MVMLPIYYFTRQLNIGIPVVATHYVTEAFYPLTLILKGSRYPQWITGVVMTIFIIVFIYGRGISFIYEIIIPASYTLFNNPSSLEHHRIVNILLVFCNFGLLYANIYWIIVIAFIYYSTVMKLLNKKPKIKMEDSN